jgi:hypothetical protein
MAPVAGCISDAKKDGLIFCPGFGQSFFAPGIPVNGIIRMLEQIRGILIN